ncbi:MAG TPA: DUF1501 domain-containing protein [Planctomycetes bacterium]|nr:DUF1501 domain-containing protein [Fuerstiella sp.]HIK94479.1 DUF1501 domain-containing protein [Planctomycetota bacterium]
MLSVTQMPRRRMLQSAGAGFGWLAARGLCGAESAPGAALPAGPHFPARAKRVIFLFMNGAPSHVDTFDPKPALRRYEGQQPSGKLERPSKGSGYMASPFRFRPYGDSGVVMSELLPRLGQVADELCVLRSMHTDEPNHEPGLLIMNSGHPQPVRPSLGSWASYGLGSENENLPAFVALSPGRPVVGPQLWSNAFLPGQHQGTAVDTNERDVNKLVANIRNSSLTLIQQRDQLDLLQFLNRRHADRRQNEESLEAHIRTMEMAFHMQSAAEEAFDTGRETQQTQEQYGDTVFGRSCLMARRLAERGVRFVQVYYVDKNQKQPWDTHNNNNSKHQQLCADSDRASAALIADLKQRGMLDDTLVIWGGEFGRTPYAQQDKSGNPRKAGRDHHNTGFSMFLAGGGVKGGMTYGATDEFGMHAVENRMHVHDLHATILHQMGIDHTRLTYRHSGRDYRLTDVHGRVVNDIVG